MKTWVLFAALQVAALAVIAHRYILSDIGLGQSNDVCGLLQSREYVITSRRVVLPEGIQPAAVRIKNEKITGVALLTGIASQANLSTAAALKFGLKNIVDYGDLIVSPGLIDTHVHFNEPGREQWEGFLTGTKAAAAGGTTTVIVMPLNAHPAIVTGELLEKMIAASKDKLWVDTGFWGGLVPSNAANHSVLQGLLDAGALGFKSFMSPAGIDDFETMLESDISAALPFLKNNGVPYYVHAEVPDGTGFEGDVRRHKNWEDCRPPRWEQNAIRALIRLITEEVASPAKQGFSLHIAHMSDTGSLPAIVKAKSQGVPLSVETCPHYLNFASEDIPDGATVFKCAPPIRGRQNREEIWEGLKDGSVDSLASDHSPCPKEMKRLEQGDFNAAWGGIAGLQYNLPSTWDGMLRRGLSPELLTKWWSEAPAKLAGLEAQKGAIAEGLDADLMIWDPESPADTSVESLQHRHKLSPYVGKKMFGRVLATFVRGQQVFAQGDAAAYSKQSCGKVLLKKWQ